MNFLHLAMGSPEIDRSLREAGHRVERINWKDWKGREALQAHVLNVCAKFRPDVVFMQLQTPNVIHPHTVHRMREGGAVVMNWTGDVRDPLPDHYPHMAPHVNVTLFTNGTDVDKMRAMGYHADYLQIGYDETIYKLLEQPTYRSGVVFIGNNYGDKFPESRSRAKLVEALRTTFGHKFEVYGSKWGSGARPCISLEEVDIYHHALVAVNWDHFVRPYFASDRILRAQACGACVLSQDYAGLRDEHPEVVGADTVERMVELVDLRLKTPHITASIGERQAQHVAERHTWGARVSSIIALANKYR